MSSEKSSEGKENNSNFDRDGDDDESPTKRKAMSAFSQPKPKTFALKALARKKMGRATTTTKAGAESADPMDLFSSILPPPIDPPTRSSRAPSSSSSSELRKQTPRKKPPKTKMLTSKKFLHTPKPNTDDNDNNDDNKPSVPKKRRSFRVKDNEINYQKRRPRTPAVKPSADTKPNREKIASMLPPPLKNPNDYDREDSTSFSSMDMVGSSDPSRSSSHSSWEQFLGTKPRPADKSAVRNDNNPSNKQPKEVAEEEDDDDELLLLKQPPSMAKLPSIRDLFPPDLSSENRDAGDTNNSKGRPAAAGDKEDIAHLFPSSPRRGDRQPSRPSRSKTGSSRESPFSNPSLQDSSGSFSSSSSTSSRDREGSSSSAQPPPQQEQQQRQQQQRQQQQRQQQQMSPLEGVLPVSDLFYRSSQSMDSESEEGDDEELPFSAEQTDQLAVNHNKVKVRRNEASYGSSSSSEPSTSGRDNTASQPKPATTTTPNTSARGRRKMIRRGMEMLVGGVPINADPPQRNIELWYNHETPQPCWYDAISVNTPDFGPFFHSGSQHELTQTELGLFCEFFVDFTLKWEVCPKDLRDVMFEFHEELFRRKMQNESKEDQAKKDNSNIPPMPIARDALQSIAPLIADLPAHFPGMGDAEKAELMGALQKIFLNGDGKLVDEDGQIIFDAGKLSIENGQIATSKPTISAKADPSKGFARPNSKTKKKPKKARKDKKYKGPVTYQDSAQMCNIEAHYELYLGATPSDFAAYETPETDESGRTILKDVLRKGFMKSIERELQHVSFAMEPDVGPVELKDVEVMNVDTEEEEDGTTLFVIVVKVRAKVHSLKGPIRVQQAMTRTTENGEMQLSLAAAVREETRWPEKFRERLYEEILFEEEEEDKLIWPDAEKGLGGDAATKTAGDSEDEATGSQKSTSTGKASPRKEGVVWDYSEANIDNAPYQGVLGPRLLEAMQEYAKEHPPKVIAIGDVHGCIEELQDLLRECNYHPGDLIVFLGDLVSKGPDSISVVQMAREIGAIGVRGNHDFEVIRWHQAIQSSKDISPN